MKQIVFLIIVVFVFSCKEEQEQEIRSPVYMARIFQTDIEQFGYEISKDSVLIIRQAFIPGINGNHGFYSRDDAEKGSKLTIEKLNRGTGPPSITVAELDSLKIRLQ